MECNSDVIPSKLSFDMFHGDVDQYKEALYKIFKRDFIDSDVYYNGC